MHSARSALWNVATVAQLMLAAAVLGILAFTPPDRGEMLLISLSGQPLDRTRLAQLPMVAERPGPLPGSLLVYGSSEGQFWPLLRRGVLILSAPRPLCGAPALEAEA